MKIIPNKGVTAPQGFKAAGVNCGIKASGKKDLALVFSEVPAKTTAFFTTNRVAAAPVLVSKTQLQKSKNFSAVVINSGNANACTGPGGISNALEMINLTAAQLSLDSHTVLVASTGIIGTPLPLEKIEKGIILAAKNLSVGGDNEAAQAIMTTDSFSKEMAVEFEVEGKKIRLGAMAKGAGMIAPHLAPHATMIAVFTTDAYLSSLFLEKALEDAIGNSFNCISVDGDTSTNDTVFLLANGLAKNEESALFFEKFQEALNFVSLNLAKMILKDGEGATKLITYKIQGAKNSTGAQMAVKTVANSLLVKTAFFGEELNWGRLMAALGCSGAEIDPGKVDIFLNEHQIVKNGEGIKEANIQELKEVLARKELEVIINLNQGDAAATFYGCDLSYEYVKINSGMLS